MLSYTSHVLADGPSARKGAPQMANRRYRLECECSDPGCPVHLSDPCPKRATTTLRRIDFADEPRVQFCNECAADAMDSGVFA